MISVRSHELNSDSFSEPRTSRRVAAITCIAVGIVAVAAPVFASQASLLLLYERGHGSLVLELSIGGEEEEEEEALFYNPSQIQVDDR